MRINKQSGISPCASVEVVVFKLESSCRSVGDTWANASTPMPPRHSADRQLGSSADTGNAAARVALVRALYLGGGYAEAWAEVELARSLGQSVPAELLRDLAARMPEPGK
jgi:hypothetical protein